MCLLNFIYSYLSFTFTRDVHVVHLDNGQGDPFKTTNKSVHIHLTAGWSDNEVNRSRDVALVLKSARPVRWIISSAPILTGSLLIVTEHAVDIHGLSTRQQPIVRRDQNLPEAFALLILSVTADLFPPVSYVRAPMTTNSMEIVIGKKYQLRLLSSSSKGAIKLKLVMIVVLPFDILHSLSSLPLLAPISFSLTLSVSCL